MPPPRSANPDEPTDREGPADVREGVGGEPQPETESDAAEQPHDALFKAVFSEPANAKGELVSLLPGSIVDALDLDSIEPVPASFVDEALRQAHSDLLLRAPLRDAGEAFVYVLFEHRSTPDPLMPWRLLRYMVRIWERWLAARPQARRLPAILPIVLYHGARPWTAPRSLTELIDLAPDLVAAGKSWLPDFRLLIDDLAAIPEADLADRPLPPFGQGALLLLQAAPRAARDPGAFVEMIGREAHVFRRLTADPADRERLVRLLRYTLSVSEVSPHALARALEALAGRSVAEQVMTTAERLRIEGRAEGSRAIARQVLTARFGALPAQLEARLNAMDADAVAALTARALRAASLDESFGPPAEVP